MSFEASGDSFVVYVTPPGDTFPMVRVALRRKERERGRVSEEREIVILGGKTAYDGEENFRETALRLGMEILNHSGIISDWRRDKH